jgi:hypothetical protein
MGAVGPRDFRWCSGRYAVSTGERCGDQRMMPTDQGWRHSDGKAGWCGVDSEKRGVEVQALLSLAHGHNVFEARAGLPQCTYCTAKVLITESAGVAFV